MIILRGKNKMKEYFWKISGGDHIIISQCEKSIQLKYQYVGFIVFCISIICFLSCLYGLNELFSNLFLSFPISLFFAWMISNIYLVLLTTFSKNTLPHVKHTRAVIVSTSIRMIFVIFIAIVVSKPLEVNLYSSAIDGKLKSFKRELINDAEFSLIHKYDSKIIQLRKEIFNKSKTVTIESLKEAITQLEKKKAEEHESLRNLLNNSTYFLQRLKLLYSECGQSWLFTFSLIFIFLLPVLIKYYISATSSYYERKSVIERKMIFDEYLLFKKHYSDLFYQKTGKQIQFDERFENPPFNTLPKVDQRSFETEKDFLNMIYGAEN